MCVYINCLLPFSYLSYMVLTLLGWTEEEYDGDRLVFVYEIFCSPSKF
jgi:hypothetical protein